MLKALQNRIFFDGEILFDNASNRNLSTENLITYIPQDFNVFDSNFLNNVTVFGLYNYNQKIVDEILTISNMQHLLSYDSLLTASQGEKEIVMIVRAILSENEIIILDEPFGNLAIKLKAKILNYLNNYSQKTILIVDHSNINLYPKNFKILNFNN